MDAIGHLLEDFESKIQARNRERETEGLARLPKANIRLLGQCSLLVNPNVSQQLSLAQTLDVDALLTGHIVLDQLFRQVVHAHGLLYDELSSDIWIPPESTFSLLHSSDQMECYYLDPLFTLLSKAIKAKEKNRILVSDGLALFGDELVTSIKKFGGDPNFFLKRDKREGTATKSDNRKKKKN